MNAQQLFNEGVTAIREKKDTQLGRRLLTQSLKLDANNVMAWLWLSSTFAETPKRIECVRRALQIDPQHKQALALQRRLLEPATSTQETPAVIAVPAKKAATGLTAQDLHHIQQLMEEAERFHARQDDESALKNWEMVLDIQPDHVGALERAAAYLWRVGRHGQARRRVWEGLASPTPPVKVYQMAIYIAENEVNMREADALRLQMVRLPYVETPTLMQVVDYFRGRYQWQEAVTVLQIVAQREPQNQEILLLLADLKHELNETTAAMQLYDQAVLVNKRSALAKAAEKKLQDFVPRVNEAEKQSVWLAVREAAGFGIIFWLLAVQDAGLNVLAMGLQRWLGVLLSCIGGYMLVTATSSPAQSVIVRLLRGNKNEAAQENDTAVISDEIRQIIGIVGVVVIIVAFGLVFSRAIGLLFDPVEPDLTTLEQLLYGE